MGVVYMCRTTIRAGARGSTRPAGTDMLMPEPPPQAGCSADHPRAAQPTVNGARQRPRPSSLTASRTAGLTWSASCPEACRWRNSRAREGKAAPQRRQCRRSSNLCTAATCCSEGTRAATIGCPVLRGGGGGDEDARWERPARSARPCYGGHGAR